MADAAGDAYAEAYVPDDGGEEDVDADLAAVQAMMQEAEETNSKIAETAESATKEAAEVLADKAKKEEERKLRDERSVFVTNVHWEATGEEVAAYFSSCGPVERCTIVTDRYGAAKGCVRGAGAAPQWAARPACCWCGVWA